MTIMTYRELLQQALDALKKYDDKWLECGERVWFEEEIKAIEEILAQPEPEPMVWVSEDISGQTLNGKKRRIWWENEDGIGFPIYTAPPNKEWVGLTDRELLQQLFNDLEDEVKICLSNDFAIPEWLDKTVATLRTRLAQPEPMLVSPKQLHSELNDESKFSIS